MVLTIFFGILGLGIMIFVHEFGHFLAAKLVGIQVEVFSLGWGKKLIGFEHCGTSYQISWFPIGGYCKMKGDNPLKSEAAAEESPESEPGQSEYRVRDESPVEEGAFFGAAPWKRILVAASGPTANILFAIMVLTLIWWIGFNIYSDHNRIVLVSDYSLDAFENPPPATTSGLKSGDIIMDINGQPVEKFQDILEKVSTSPDRELTLLVQRESRLISVQVVPDLDLQTGAGRIGVYAWRNPVIDQVQAEGSAGIAGLKAGDRIISFNGKEIRHTIDFFQVLKESPETAQVKFIRDNVEQNRSMVLHYNEDGIPDPGLSFRLSVFSSPRLSFPGAILKGAQETLNTFFLTLKGIGLLFRGMNFRNAVAGPLRITYYVGSVATRGFSFGISAGLISFFRFLCLLSVVLFLMNLLPLPALDGGQITIFLLEILRGKPINPKIIYRIQIFGFSLLILLAVYVTFSDILFFMGR